MTLTFNLIILRNCYFAYQYLKSLTPGKVHYVCLCARLPHCYLFRRRRKIRKHFNTSFVNHDQIRNAGHIYLEPKHGSKCNNSSSLYFTKILGTFWKLQLSLRLMQLWIHNQKKAGKGWWKTEQCVQSPLFFHFRISMCSK